MRWADSIRMFFSKLLGEEADDCVWIPFTQNSDSWKLYKICLPEMFEKHLAKRVLERFSLYSITGSTALLKRATLKSMPKPESE